MGMADLATKPPSAIIDQAITASDSKVGMWALEKTLDPLDRQVMASQKKNMDEFLSEKNTSGIKPYILIDSVMLALPIQCAFQVQHKKFALTAHAARHRGYTVVDNCYPPELSSD